MLSTRTVEYSHLEDLVNLLNKKYNSQCELVLNDSKLMPFSIEKRRIPLSSASVWIQF